MAISIVLADAHPLFVAGLKQVLAAEADFNVLAVCAAGAETLATVREKRPDLLVIDLPLKGIDGLSVLRQLREQDLPTRAVVLTGSLGADEAIEVMRLGVAGVVLKDMAAELIVRCLRKVAGGGRWMETQSVANALEKILKREAAAQEVSKNVSRRELSVIRMVAAGLRNKEVARALSITEGTVKAHLHSVYDKLKVKGRGALSALARRKGLV